ncbi:MAG: hypothetical protein J6S85_11260 [Methanobrevibacter sp.]|nr:hypothetical protein [Methanobrevibacter sp.]
MKKYAKVVNETTKLCNVGVGTNIEYYKSLGMTEQDVEQAYDGKWYLTGYAPSKPAPTLKEQLEELERTTGYSRAIRELILAENSGASEYVKNKAQEIENIAEQIRG